jgi:hypothetical protein
MRKHRLILCLAAILALACPAHAWHCRYVVVVPGTASYAAAPASGQVYSASYSASYAAAPVASYAAAPAMVYSSAAPALTVAAAPTLTYATLASYAVSPPAAAAYASQGQVAAAPAPCAASVTDREIADRLDRVGASLGAGPRLKAVQPMSNAQLTERLAQLAATVEALAQVVDNHGKKLGGK